jgi:hypothetical protein
MASTLELMARRNRVTPGMEISATVRPDSRISIAVQRVVPGLGAAATRENDERDSFAPKSILRGRYLKGRSLSARAPSWSIPSLLDTRKRESCPEERQRRMERTKGFREMMEAQSALLGVRIRVEFGRGDREQS